MITRLTPKVLNSDSDETLLKPTEMMDAINIQLSSRNQSSAGIVKSTKGNVVVSLSESIAQYSAGKNTVIGTVSDENLGVIFFFVHNDAGNHGIYAYSTKTQTHRLIFKGSILNFEPNGFVKGDLVRIKRKSQDEEFIVVDVDDDFPGGGPIFETEEILTVPRYFYYERDFSLLAETAKIFLPQQLGFDAEPDTWDGTSVPIGMRAIVEISNDETPHLGAFYPEAGDVASPANSEAFANPSAYNTLEFDLPNTLGQELSNPDIQDQFDGYESFESTVRSWIRNGAFQVNLHPDAISDPSTSIKVTLRVLNTETGDLDVGAIDSFSTEGGDTVWPEDRSAPTHEFTYTSDDLTPSLIGDLGATGAELPNAFGHETVSELVRVVDAFYSQSPSVGGSIIGGLETQVLGGATHVFSDAGSRYHDISSLVYSESDSSTVMGNRIVMARVSVDFSQRGEWLEYRDAWQILYDSQNQDVEPPPAGRLPGERSSLCDGFSQPSCLGWAGNPGASPFMGYLEALESAAFLNATYGCTLTVINPFPCEGVQIQFPEFNPGFVMVGTNDITLHTPENTSNLPDLEASLNGTADNVPDPSIHATGIYDFLVPVEVSGPGSLYRSNNGFAVVDSTVFGGTVSLNASQVGEAIAEELNQPGEVSLSVVNDNIPKIINKASTSGEGITSAQGGASLTYYPRPFTARGVFSATNDSVSSISEAIYDEITVDSNAINTWINDSSGDYGNFTDLVFPNYTLQFTRSYGPLEAASDPDNILEDNKDFCFGFFENCDTSGQRLAGSFVDTESVVSETSTEERKPSTDDDSAQEKQATPESGQPPPAGQAAQKSKTKTSKGY